MGSEIIFWSWLLDYLPLKKKKKIFPYNDLSVQAEVLQQNFFCIVGANRSVLVIFGVAKQRLTKDALQGNINVSAQLVRP